MKISIDKLRQKSEQEIINLLKQYPYPSQWENKESLAHAEYTLALIQGKRYQQTGNIKSLKEVSND